MDAIDGGSMPDQDMFDGFMTQHPAGDNEVRHQTLGQSDHTTDDIDAPKNVVAKPKTPTVTMDRVKATKESSFATIKRKHTHVKGTKELTRTYSHVNIQPLTYPELYRSQTHGLVTGQHGGHHGT